MLHVGYGEADLTPEVGGKLIGYGLWPHVRRSESLESELKVHALALDDGEGQLLLLSCDLLGLNTAFCDRLRAALAAEHGTTPERVLISCTHTHCGPPTPCWDVYGVPEPEYVARLERELLAAVRAARQDLQPAQLSYRVETIEPIGFNRRHKNFEIIDPLLKVAVFTRPGGKIFLLNYACHATTLGASPLISAEWPGKAVAHLEQAGHLAVVFQGFPGDINPTARANAGETPEVEDLELMGEILCRRALKAEQYAQPVPDPRLRAAEKRLRLPLFVPSRESLEPAYRHWKELWGSDDPGFNAWIENWLRDAQAAQPARSADPFTDPAPIQAAAIGSLKILGLPAEVFNQYATRLYPQFPGLLSFGYCGGEYTYWPTREAYHDLPDSYESQFAPLVGFLFRFDESLEDVVRASAVELLTGLG